MSEPVSTTEKAIKKLVSQQYFCVLTTLNGISPYPSLVGFISNDDLTEIYFATFCDTAKYRNIKANPSVSLLIDNRINSMDALELSMALSVTGKAEEVPAEESARIKNCYLEKFPRLKKFIEDPESRFIRIRAEKFILSEKFGSSS